MLAKLLERLYPPLPAQPKDPVDRTRVVVVGVPSVWEELPTSDLRTLWFLSYISVQKGITCEGIVASSPRLAPSKQLPYVSTTGVYDGEVFDSLLSWLQAHPGSEHATLSPEAFAIHSAIERTLYEPFYRWLCTQRTELAVQIYGRPQDPFVWLRRMHFRFVDYPQHFKAKKINLVSCPALIDPHIEGCEAITGGA
jgi:hypothetical protein